MAKRKILARLPSTGYPSPYPQHPTLGEHSVMGEIEHHCPGLGAYTVETGAPYYRNLSPPLPKGYFKGYDIKTGLPYYPNLYDYENTSSSIYPTLVANTLHDYEESYPYTNLPDPGSRGEAIFDMLYKIAKEQWPTQTEKAEAWVKKEAIRYGIAEAKTQAQQVAQSPWTWIIGGLVLGWVVSRSR